MAVKLDTSKGTRDVKAQTERDRNLRFKLVRIGVIAITVVSIGFSVRAGVVGYQQMTAADKKIEELNVSYERLKDEAAVWHEANDDKDPQDESGATIKQQAMYSAKLAGDEVAAIQTDYANSITHEIFGTQKDRLKELTGQTGCWFGNSTKGYDASTNPVKLTWEFLTWYDARSVTYDCVWACWYTDDNDPSARYLMSMRFGKYNGETNSFNMSNGDTFITSFGTMVEKYGAVKAEGGSSQTTQDILDITDDLLGGGQDGENSTVDNPDGDAAEDQGGEAAGSQDGGDGEGSSDGSDEATDGGQDAGTADPDIGNIEDNNAGMDSM